MREIMKIKQMRCHTVLFAKKIVRIPHAEMPSTLFCLQVTDIDKNFTRSQLTFLIMITY